MSRNTLYILIIAVFSVILLTFRPGIWLVDKPASSDKNYARGWRDGCISGTNSYSLLYAPMLESPFVKEVEEPASAAAANGAATPADGTKSLYKSGWNEGFTLCRYYQSGVYELMQFAIIVTTLLFIGYTLARKRQD
jgi:hypothetical protein